MTKNWPYFSANSRPTKIVNSKIVTFSIKSKQFLTKVSENTRSHNNLTSNTNASENRMENHSCEFNQKIRILKLNLDKFPSIVLILIVFSCDIDISNHCFLFITDLVRNICEDISHNQILMYLEEKRVHLGRRLLRKSQLNL